MPIKMARMGKKWLDSLRAMSNIKVFATQDGRSDGRTDGHTDKYDSSNRSIYYSYG